MNREMPGGAEPYNYREHDRIWKRVSPSLTPFEEGEDGTAQTAQEMMPAAQLPGAQANPCCMGTAAQADLAVVEGFVEEELQARWALQNLARRAPAPARGTLWAAARRCGEHVRRLLTVHYLITGRCYRPAVSWQEGYSCGYCAALRELYHGAACQWMNYIRAAEGTTDPCLQKVYRELAAEKERLADSLTALLEQALTGTCSP